MRTRWNTWLFGLLMVGGFACEGEEDPGGEPGSRGEQVREGDFARALARCQCPTENGGYETARACAERFAFNLTYVECNVGAWAATDVDDASVDCYAEAYLKAGDCYADIEGCDLDAVRACDSERNDAVASCDPALAEFPPDTYFDALRACEGTEVVGPASGCDPGSAVSQTGTAVFSGTTVGGGDDVTPGCSSRTSADAEHLFRAPSAGRYRFDTDGSAGEHALAILDQCGGTELACDEWEEGGPPNRQAVVEVDLTADQEVVVVVDALGPSLAGRYQVNVTLE